MNWKIAALLSASVALCQVASADNPYQAILTRNAFALIPKPVPVADPPPAPVLPDIKLCGFVVKGSQTRALFAEVPKNGKGDDTFYSLSEGQSDGILQLLKIRFDQQEADILNSGVPMRLNLRENGLKIIPVAQPAPPPRPVPSAIPTVMPPPPPVPGVNLPQSPRIR